MRWMFAFFMLVTIPPLARGDETAVLVVFDSRSGHTESFARAVAEGAASVEGVSAVLRRRDDVRDEDILSSSGILLGSPVHWGSLSAESKSFLDRVGQVLVDAKELGPGTRVVSMPCVERFERQDASYRESVVPKSCTRRVSIEAGVTYGWARWVGPGGVAIGIDRFGASAPGNVVMEKLGITAKHVIEAAKGLPR